MPDPMTTPIPGLGTCGWCEISLSAIPDTPRQLEPYGRRYHPCCVGAARSKAAGLR